MEDGGKAGQIGADESGVASQLFDGPGGGREHGAVSGILMRAAEKPKLFGYGNREQEVITGQSPFKLGLQPPAAFVILTLGAMAVAAGPVDQMFFAAAVAPIDSDAVRSGTAVDDGIDGLFMLQRQMGIFGDVFITEDAEDLCNIGHDHTSFMTSLMI
jgi:hypothetical protein